VKRREEGAAEILRFNHHISPSSFSPKTSETAQNITIFFNEKPALA
jgi:hypothetical protein